MYPIYPSTVLYIFFKVNSLFNPSIHLDTAAVRRRKQIAIKEAFKKDKPTSSTSNGNATTAGQVTIEEDDDEVGNTETVDLTNWQELPHQVI